MLSQSWLLSGEGWVTGRHAQPALRLRITSIYQGCLDNAPILAKDTESTCQGGLNKESETKVKMGPGIPLNPGHCGSARLLSTCPLPPTPRKPS